MACSFVLSSLNIEKNSEEDINLFFEENEEQRIRYTNSLTAWEKVMEKMGGMEQLIMFFVRNGWYRKEYSN